MRRRPRAAGPAPPHGSVVRNARWGRDIRRVGGERPGPDDEDMTQADSHTPVRADRRGAAAPATRAASVKAFSWHYVQMLIAMTAGMMAFTPLWIFAFDRLGRPGVLDRPDVSSLTMATSMALAMGLWMRFRHHSWISVLQMSAAMYLAFAVLFPFLWAGVLSGDAVVLVGHVLMLPLMGLAMVLRKAEYLPGHHHH